MSHTSDPTMQHLGAARMALAQAVTRSSAGQVMTTMEHLAAAVDRLEAAGRDELAAVVEDIREGDCLCSQARYDLRQLMQLLDVDVQDHIEDASPFESGSESEGETEPARATDGDASQSGRRT